MIHLERQFKDEQLAGEFTGKWHISTPTNTGRKFDLVTIYLPT